MNKQEKMNNIVANAVQLRYQILGSGFNMDEKLSEDLQRAFEDVSLTILVLQSVYSSIELR